MNATQHIWLDGELIPASQARFSVLEHGLHYGTGVFEGIRSYETRDGRAAVFRLRDHLERMERGGRALGMELDVDTLERATLEVLERNQHTNAYIRPVAFYGGGNLGLDVEPLELRIAVASLIWSSHLGEAARTRGIRLMVSTMRRNSARSLPPLKICGGYANSIMAKLEARRSGFEEALFVDDEGFVCEASAENIFMIRDGEVTAVEHPDALVGITRETIIELAGAESRPVTLDELLEADEVFLTGTSAEVVSVSAIGEREFPLGPIARELQALYAAIVSGESDSHAGWLTRH